MTEPKPPIRPRRSYPAACEKVIPVALGVLIVAPLSLFLGFLRATTPLRPGDQP